MKKSIKLLAAIVLAIILLPFYSCSEDEIVCQPKIIEKEVIYHYQDNVVQIDGRWYINSNGDLSNWTYYEEIGFKVDEGFLFVYADPSVYEIVDIELYNFNYSWSLSQDSNYNYYLESPMMWYYYNHINEYFYVKLKLKEIN